MGLKRLFGRAARVAKKVGRAVAPAGRVIGAPGAKAFVRIGERAQFGQRGFVGGVTQLTREVGRGVGGTLFGKKGAKVGRAIAPTLALTAVGGVGAARGAVALGRALTGRKAAGVAAAAFLGRASAPGKAFGDRPRKKAKKKAKKEPARRAKKAAARRRRTGARAGRDAKGQFVRGRKVTGHKQKGRKGPSHGHGKHRHRRIAFRTADGENISFLAKR